MRKSHVALAAMIFSLCTWIGCSTVKEKEVFESHSIYLQMDMNMLSEEAQWIVHGTVIEKGETFLRKWEPVTEDSVDHAYTPYTIEVIDCLKGTIDGDTIVYNADGGETETAIYLDDGGGEVAVGDEVLIFLNEVGVSWGAQGVYVVKGGAVTVSSHILPNQMLSEGEAVQSYQVDVDDFIAFVRESVDTVRE